MGVQVAGSYLHWSQSPSSSFNQSCSIASPSSFSSKRRTQSCHVLRRVDRSSLFSQSSNKLLRSASSDVAKLRFRPLPRASSASANLDGFSDEEFAEKLRELALQFSVSEEEDEQSTESSSSSSSSSSFSSSSSSSSSSTRFVNNTRPTTSPLHLRSSRIESIDPPWLKKLREWGEAAETDEIIPAIERKANSVDLPLSLRIIKKKNQLSQEFLEAGESAVKKAFSSMVFIIRELHSYTLQMREVLFFEDLQGVLARVQEELNASFVWLFQQIFSHTPTLMVSVMILLANFTVHSMANNVALASPLHAAPVSQMEFIQTDSQRDQKFDSSTVKTFSISSSTAPIGGVNGGGGKFNQIASAPDGGDGKFNQISSFNHQIVPEELSKVSSFRSNPTMEPGVNTESQEKIAFDDEMKLWNSMVDEAARMQTIDQETMQQFVRPCSVEIEPEYYSDYYRTELMYEIAVSQNPDNSLLLGNYAQFLYLVNHEYDRAEEYFKLASQVKPADAEAFSNYATFLWIARKDVNAAEENYLEAIEADPGNAYHAATYAHFLWNTGGEDTCYPLGSV